MSNEKKESLLVRELLGWGRAFKQVGLDFYQSGADCGKELLTGQAPKRPQRKSSD